jgi:hypothetical protein
MASGGHSHGRERQGGADGPTRQRHGEGVGRARPQRDGGGGGQIRYGARGTHAQRHGDGEGRTSDALRGVRAWAGLAHGSRDHLFVDGAPESGVPRVSVGCTRGGCGLGYAARGGVRQGEGQRAGLLDAMRARNYAFSVWEKYVSGIGKCVEAVYVYDPTSCECILMLRHHRLHFASLVNMCMRVACGCDYMHESASKLGM